ncbi:T-box transcription factor TBX6-like [Vespa mandarinia]|uniref:T-box transcription factor TBX6-like n=1 Tax=Vespa mandarinia TaxID=7446 RepID=UPI00161C5A6E|nr:T-box transcription factor TBX6-like [Vespa mandarinia]XP_047349042.1 T-box transcription factor TBX6-like [Vespa velutina]
MYMKPRILPVPLELQFHAQLHHHHQQHQQMLYRQQQLALRRNISEDVQITNRWPVAYLGGGPPLPGDVKVDLQNRKLWKQFYAETTEMIITKSGRRMFPSVKITVSGLEKRTRYCILLEVVPASDRRQKYVESGGGVDEADTKNGGRLSSRGWMSTGFAEPQPEIDRRIYLHPDSPATGDHWMQQLPISFSKLKITNNSVEHQNNIVLTSMHKYQVRIWIIRCDDLTRIKDFHNYPSSAFTFKETEFIAVTAYQNENITKLKIDNNPFAKGFRDSGQSRCKRKFPRQNNEQEEANRLANEEEIATSLESTQRSTMATTGGSPSENESLDESELSGSEDRSSHSSIKNRRLNDQNDQPKLHRPWTNDSTPRPSSMVVTLPIAPVISPSTFTDLLPLESYLRLSHRFHSLTYYPQYH